VRFDPEDWAACAAYRRGLELFDRGEWWECHEQLEEVWRAAGRGSEAGRFLQGLIQLAAAHHQRERGARGGAERLARRALARLAERSGVFLGVDAPSLVAQSRAFFAGARADQARIRPSPR
jgi:predicted metal-dependent hydrolase